MENADRILHLDLDFWSYCLFIYFVFLQPMTQVNERHKNRGTGGKRDGKREGTTKWKKNRTQRSSERVERERGREGKRREEEILLILILQLLGVESRNSVGGTEDSLCRLFTKKIIKVCWNISLQPNEARCFPGDQGLSVSLPAWGGSSAPPPFNGWKLNVSKPSRHLSLRRNKWLPFIPVRHGDQLPQGEIIHDSKHESIIWFGPTPFTLHKVVWFRCILLPSVSSWHSLKETETKTLARKQSFTDTSL